MLSRKRNEQPNQIEKKLNRTQQSGNKKKKYDLIGWNLLFNSFL